MSPAHFGAVVLCGGKSSRMGRSKALLPFGSETMLQRTIRTVREATAGPIVVVAAAAQELPPLPADVAVVVDARSDRGPLEGMAAGLRHLAPASDVAFVTSCDVPLLTADFIRFVHDHLGPDDDAAAPYADAFLHPLSATYRIATVLPEVELLLAADRLRATGIFERIRTRSLDETTLRAVDPTLASLHNINRPDAYHDALRAAGFTP
ncbi:MAG: molybdopterin-guanine dinucleotide biosynthesis protein MobA [Pirellula sp.]|nr:molybdopterin-guanine dinucleotide biosynthesis protein MobA [Pirellula sp.]